MTDTGIKSLLRYAIERLQPDSLILAAITRSALEEIERLEAELSSYHCTCGHSLLTGHHEDDCPHRQMAKPWWAVEIERLKAENFALAAGQCPLNLIVMDPWGNPKCAAIAVHKENAK